jgi:probable phosphoglycerate mutase
VTTDRPRIWLARHGETEWTLSGQHTGRTDIALTPAGRRQAQALGRYLAARSFALVLTSPLGRAQETCRLAGYGSAAEVTDDLREWDYGIYEGRTTAAIRAVEPGWSIWTSPIPEGESLEQVGARAHRVMDRTLGAGGDVVLFGHAHILRVLAACWIGRPPGDGRLFALATASISVLGWEREGRVIETWNVTSE